MMSILVTQLVYQFCSCVHVTLNTCLGGSPVLFHMQLVGLHAVFGTCPQGETVQQSTGQQWIVSTIAQY